MRREEEGGEKQRISISKNSHLKQLSGLLRYFTMQSSHFGSLIDFLIFRKTELSSGSYLAVYRHEYAVLTKCEMAAEEVKYNSF